MIPQLRSYQLDAVQRVCEAARTAKVIVLQASTGSGKTTMACELVASAVANGSRVLMIVHRRRLVDQMSERLSDFRIDHGVFMNGRPHRQAKVQVASRDTMLSRCNEWEGMPPANLCIVDEGRHGASPQYRQLLRYY